MLPEIRTAFLGVAIKAGLIESHLGKLPFARRAVSAMTTAAIHLALPDRVGIRLERLRSLLLVAFEAHFGLCRCHQDRIGRSMTRMAVGAGDVIHIMIIAVPAKARIGCMTIQAKAILNIDRCAAALAKNRAWRRPLLAATNATRVITRGTVTGLALQLAVAEWTIGIRRYRVRTAEECENRLLLMAGETTIGSLTAVVGLLTVSSADGQGC
jgi:hypothetical protein